MSKKNILFALKMWNENRKLEESLNSIRKILGMEITSKYVGPDPPKGSLDFPEGFDIWFDPASQEYFVK